MNEKFYDEQVAPKLLELAKLCQDNGLTLLATVEWDQDGRGTTFATTEKTSWAMRCFRAAHECGEFGTFNVDKFILGLMRSTHGDPHSSIVFERLGRNPDGTEKSP